MIKRLYVTLNNINKFSQSNGKKSVAVMLSGCGVYDGSEIHEASSCLIHLSKINANVSIFAPNIDQSHTINHLSGEEMPNNRNCLVEAARIARGQISALDKLSANDFDALIIPGGFGAAKNLSNFAFRGSEYSVNEQVGRCILDFVNHSKPIGVCCIAPNLIAKLVPGAELTMGGEREENGKWPYAGSVENIVKVGAKHVETDQLGVHVDRKHMIVSTPAYMCGTAPLYDIYRGIGSMIDAVMAMTTSRK